MRLSPFFLLNFDLGGDVGERMPETDEMFTTREGKLRIRDSFLLHRISNLTHDTGIRIPSDSQNNT